LEWFTASEELPKLLSFLFVLRERAARLTTETDERDNVRSPALTE
jgi:hypothetical protein